MSKFPLPKRPILRRTIGVLAKTVKLLVMGRVVLFIGIVIAIGCVKSPKGSISELVHIAQPTFGGLTNRNYSVPSNFYSLVGECEPKSLSLEYSYDQVTWVNVTCNTNRTFTIALHVITFLDVYARAGRPGGFTGISHARVTFANAPTTPTFAFVTSGAADPDNALGTQNAMDLSLTSATLNGGAIVIKPSLIDSTYE